MTRIILSGASGAMGHKIAEAAAERNDCVIVAGVDIQTESNLGFQIFSCPKDITAQADVIIDFSHPAALESLLEYALEKKLPIVVATTGLSEEQCEKIESVSKVIPVFHTGNMSLGINLLIALSKQAVKVLGSSFDIEIVEKHHNKKIDAPSGTALMIAREIAAERDLPSTFEYDRHSVRRAREKSEIGIHSVRGGTIVGEHEVIFAGHDEVVTISHSAQSKGVFATGAINAALFLTKSAPGLYDMNDLLNN